MWCSAFMVENKDEGRRMCCGGCEGWCSVVFEGVDLDEGRFEMVMGLSEEG